MSQYGQHAYGAPMHNHSSQRVAPPQAGYVSQMQQQQPMAGGAYQHPYKGTLAPGTRVKVGNITVTVKRYLSQGGFAHVYLVTTSQPIPMPSSVTRAVGASIATNAAAQRGETVHVLKRIAVPDKAALADVRREVEVHKLLRNQPNIVHFIEASATALQSGAYEIFILMEYCSGGGIISLMNARLRDRLREEEVLKIFGDVCAGVAVMHHLDPPLMHRDLKVENILMAPSTDPATIPGSRSTSSNLKATFKLCDFGSAAPLLSRKPAKSMDEVKRVEADLNKHTTLQYRAPEMVDVYQRRVIDEKADIWALGVLLYKLCYYTTPFEENGGGPLAILNVQYRIPPQPVYSEKLKQLIHSLLKEQSMDRPTIDQVIIHVHQILGTRPPQAAVHYAHAAASGKIAAPLPTLVSGRPVSTLDGRPNPSGGIDANLISIGPSKKEREQAEAHQLELQKQSITPMRRGRPTKPSTLSESPNKKLDEVLAKSTSSPAPPAAAESTPKTLPTWSVPDSKPSSVKTGPLIEGFGDSFTPSTTASTETPPSLPKRPTPTSVSPDKTPDSTASPAPADRAIDKNLLRTTESDVPSPAISPLRHSPALPGFSAAPSPVASPQLAAKDPPTSASNASPRDELTDRFPSLEDLDARYGTPSSAPVSSSTGSSAPASTTGVNVPGLANRASVGAMAGRFERPFEPQRPGSGKVGLHKSATISSLPSSDFSKTRTGGVSKRWQPSILAHDKVGKEQDQLPAPLRKSMVMASSRDWLTGDASEDDAPVKVATPAKEAESKSFAAAHAGAGAAAAGAAEEGKEIEVDEPSSDEEEVEKPTAQKPVLPPRLSASRLASSASLPVQQDSNEERVNGSSKAERPGITPGRLKTPSWLVDAVDSPTAAEKLLLSPSNGSNLHLDTSVKDGGGEVVISPITDANQAEELDEAARQAQDQLEALLRGPAAEEEAQPAPKEEQKKEDSPSPTQPVAAVKAPAWDDDDVADQAEMRALAKPLSGTSAGTSAASKLSPRSEAGATGSGSGSVRGRWNAPASSKQLVDVATSPDPPLSATADKLASLTLTTATSPPSKPTPSPSPAATAPLRPSSIIAQRSAQFHTSSSSSSSAQPKIIQPQRPTPIRAVKPTDGMKPWEREAALSAAASAATITRNSPLPSASTKRLLHTNDNNYDPNPKDEADDQERFNGVSSLISKWQQNVEANAPGWGKIGK